jgi:hypothetical protein
VIPLPNISIGAAVKAGAFLFTALALLLLVHDRNHWKASAELRQQQLAQTKAAFDQTAAGYRAAAAQAQAADAANVARVEAEQSAINERTADEYQTRIAAARTDAQRLRDYKTASADPSGSGGTSVPRLPAPASGTAQAANEDRFPDADALTATEQAIQLDELIKWLRQQHALDPNSPPTARPVDTSRG